MNYILRILLSIIEIPKLFFLKKSPLLFMTLLVKDEEEMLESNLIFHKNMGVDGFIITDNNSSDRTIDIIKKYQQLGWVKEVIYEKDTNYEQKKWVDRMVLIAKNKYHADWVINADADEFWYSKYKSLKLEISNSLYNVLNCQIKSVYPEKDKPFWMCNKIVNVVDNPDSYNLSKYSIFEKQNKKVLHKTLGYIHIAMGNHSVVMFPKLSKQSNIIIYHYNIRLKEAFMKKMINGGKQLEQHEGRHGGRHWRYFYTLYKAGKLENEYDRVVGLSEFDKLMNDGYIIEDNSIVDFFKELPHKEL